MRKYLSCAVSLAALCLPLSAFGNEITNGDFENPPVQPGNFLFADPIHQGIPDWTVSGNQGSDIISDQFARDSFYFPYNGTQFCYINDGLGVTSIHQDVHLGAGPQALMFDQATFINPGDVTVSVLDGFSNPIFAPTLFSEPYNPDLGHSFTSRSLSFSIQDAGVYRIMFTSTGFSSAIIDNVDLEPTATPEPASIAALGIGAVALIKKRRNR